MPKNTLKRQPLTQMVPRKLNTYILKDEFRALFLTVFKIQLQLYQFLKVRPENWKLFEENVKHFKS